MFKLLYCSLNVSLPQFTIKSWVTCQSKFNIFLSWILKTYMTDVLWTSLERPIIWSPGHPATGSRRRPMDVPIYNFWIFAFPVKSSNRWVKQRLFHLKSTFFIKSSIFFCWSPKSPLEIPDVRTSRGPSEDFPGMLHAGWEEASPSLEYTMEIHLADIFYFFGESPRSIHYILDIYIFRCAFH